MFTSKAASAFALILTTLTACGDGSESADASSQPTADAGLMMNADAGTQLSPDAGVQGPPRARVRVVFSGTAPQGTQLLLAASVEQMLRGVPAAFATVDNPVSPATAEITFSAPGAFWISANLNAPPVGFGPPGPEDRIGVSSGPITVTAGGVAEVTIELP